MIDCLFGLSLLCRVGGISNEKVVKPFIKIQDDFEYNDGKYPIIFVKKDLSAVRISFKKMQFDVEHLLKALDIYLKLLVTLKMDLPRQSSNLATFLIKYFYKIDHGSFESPNLIKLMEMF